MVEFSRVIRDWDGLRKTLIHEDETNRLIVKSEQRLEEILAGIARKRELHRRGGDIKYTATIPTFIYEDLVARGIAQDGDRFKAWLNGPEGAPWRVWEGSL